MRQKKENKTKTIYLYNTLSHYLAILILYCGRILKKKKKTKQFLTRKDTFKLKLPIALYFYRMCKSWGQARVNYFFLKRIFRFLILVIFGNLAGFGVFFQTTSVDTADINESLLCGFCCSLVPSTCHVYDLLVALNVEPRRQDKDGGTVIALLLLATSVRALPLTILITGLHLPVKLFFFFNYIWLCV